MTPHQVTVNHQAVTNLAGRLEALGYTGDDVHQVAERLAKNLIADGYRRVEAPPPLRPTTIASDEQRRARIAQITADLDRIRRNSPTTSSGHDDQRHGILGGPEDAPSEDGEPT